MLLCAGAFSSCAAAPESLGFDDLPSGTQPNPLQYFGITFTASSGTGFPGAFQVAGTAPGPKILQGVVETNSVVTGTVDIKDSGAAAGGAFIAFSVSLNAFSTPNGRLSVDPILVSGSLNRTIDPSCQQTVPPSASMVKVNLGVNGGACVVDDLSFVTRGSDPSVANSYIQLDDFVVCKANMLSGLLPTP